MSGQLIGGVVGAAIGFYFGNPQLGWMIGSAVGGLVDPQKIDGPRLQDRRVQVSQYGAGIPIIYGSTAGTGNIIWSTDLIEHDVEEDGKGGPVTTTHTYSVSCAILIGEGVVGGVRRIWANAKLVYDISAGADSATALASAEFAKYFTFYSGTETQLPDPTIEAALGVGNVTAYRGSSYVVFTDIPLAGYGNRIPDFRFETGLSAAAAASPYQPLKLTPWTSVKPAQSSGLTEYTYGALVTTSLATLEAQLATDGFATYIGHGDLAGNNTIFGAVPDLNAGEGLNQIQLYYGLSGKTYNVVRDGVGGTACAGLVGQTSGVANAVYLLQSRGLFSPVVYLTAATGGGGDVACYSTTVPTTYRYVEPISYNDLPLQAGGGPIHSGMASAQACVDGQLANAAASTDSFACGAGGTFTRTVSQASGLVGTPTSGYSWGIRIVYAGCFNADQVSTRTILAELPPILGITEPSPAPKTITARRLVSVPASTAPTGDPCVLGVPTAITGRPGFAIACDGTITDLTVVYTNVAGTFKQLGVVTLDASNHVTQNAVGPIKLPADPEYNDAAYWEAQATIAKAAGKLLPGAVYPVVVSNAALGSGGAILTAGLADTPLSTVVSDLCVRSGMPAGTYSVAALASSIVQGFSISRQMPARAALQQLQQTYWWDFVESGRLIKAVMRGAASTLSIPRDDLGAASGSDAQVLVAPMRTQETELPATVNVAYPVRDAGYETGTQRARRTVTGSQQVMSVELSVVMSDARAAQIAAVLMYGAWTNRTHRSWVTTRKYAHHEPTDTVTLNDGEFVYSVMIEERSEEGSIIKWSGVDNLPAGYAPIVVAAPSRVVVPVMRFDGPMKLELIDSPIVLEANDDPGFYVAGAGYRASWAGGTAFRSEDAGANYATEKTLPSEATIGLAATVLGEFASGNIVDEINTVTISLLSGTLSSITAAQLLNNGNAAIIGQEIIQFRTATLVGTDRFVLSGLLRGRRGTEQHINTHAVNDRFVLFNTAVHRVSGTVSQIGMPTKQKGVTFGQLLADAVPIDFTNTAAGLKPFAPTHLQAINLGGGTYRAAWVRRTRIGGKWRDVAVPLGETSESYAVDVLSSAGVVLSSATTSASTLDVAAAPGNTVRVQQLSSTVGRGFPATVNI